MSSTIRRVINVSTDEVYGESSLGAEKGTVRMIQVSHRTDMTVNFGCCHTVKPSHIQIHVHKSSRC